MNPNRPPATKAPVRGRSTRGIVAVDHFCRRFAVLGVTAEVLAPPALAPSLAVVLRSYPQATACQEFDVRITVTRQGQMWRVVAGDRPYPDVAGAGKAARLVEWFFVTEALKRWTRYVHIHAALVATPDRSVLLIGNSGTGKSTTSVALALTGLALYTDDLALVDRATLRPVCLPRPIKLDQRSRRLLRPRGLVVPRGSTLGESIDRTVLPGLPPIDVPGPPVAAAIFFTNARRDRAELRPLTRAEAVMRLIVQSASERFDAAGPSDGAVALINTVRCYELVPGDLDTTVRAVLDLLEAPNDAVTGESEARISAAVE